MLRKITFILISIITIQKGFAQTSVFEIMFNGKTNEITNKNLNDVYLFITQVDQMVKTENNSENEYVENFKNLLINKRTNELINILNEINENLKIETTENELILTSKFSASNSSSIDLNNYLIQIENSNIKIEKTPSFNTIGVFDYSSDKSMKKIISDLNYKFALEEKIEGNLKLDLRIRAFEKCDYKIVSKKDILKELKSLGNIKIINLSRNHIVLDNSNNDIKLFPYKNEKIANVKSTMKFSIYKPIYEYLNSNKKVVLEDLRKEFPIERLKKINTKGTYQVVIFNENSLEDVLILKKEYKELKTTIEQKLYD